MSTRVWWCVAMVAGCTDWLLQSPEGPHEGPVHANLVRPVRSRSRLWSSHAPAPPEPAVRAEHCALLDHGGPVAGPDCVTATISCGDTIVGHTAGGVDRYDTAMWEQAFCWPATVPHDSGGERVYRLDMPAGEWRAFVWLDSPCADLDLMAMQHQGETCPGTGHRVSRCEAALRQGRGREQIELVSQGETTWYVVVEGRGEADGAFALQVECRPGLL